MKPIEISQYTEVTGSSCAGKTTFFESTRCYIAGGHISWCILPHVIIRCIFLAFGFSYLLLSPTKFFWIIQHFGRAHGLAAKVSALRNIVEKFGCYFLFRQHAVVVDEGISHIPFICQLTAEELLGFLSTFKKELRGMSIVLLPAPEENELVSRLIFRGHKKITCHESATKFARLNIKISEAYIASLNEQETLNVRTI